MFDKFQVWVKMVKMGKMANWSRWARWSDTLTTLSAHTRAKRRSSWSFGAFQQPEPSLWQLGWCDIALLVDRSTKMRFRFNVDCYVDFSPKSGIDLYSFSLSYPVDYPQVMNEKRNSDITFKKNKNFNATAFFAIKLVIFKPPVSG